MSTNLSSKKEKSLQVADFEMWSLINNEKQRQMTSLELVASENYASRSTLECMGTCLTNKYAEGFPSQRLPRGTTVIDKIEILTQMRLLELFHLKSANISQEESAWGVNVQPYSGTPANMAIYLAFLERNDVIMGLRCQDGGHPSHGLLTKDRSLSASSRLYNTIPYCVDPKTGIIDYEALERDAKRINPKIIIAGSCAYPRLLDYGRFRKICDTVGAILLADMAHISGLVAAQVIPSPFNESDLVSSTTHKTLRGPRSGLIFYRRKSRTELGFDYSKCTIPVEDYENRINSAVFPGLQSGPHENVIAAVGVTANEANTTEFKQYSTQILKNAQSLANSLMEYGIKLVTDGTDIHFVVVDLIRTNKTKPNLNCGDAPLVQIVGDSAGIIMSAIPLPLDESVDQMSGLRIGTPALTSRGLDEDNFKTVAGFIDEVLNITSFAKSVLTNTGDVRGFETAIKHNSIVCNRIDRLRNKVSEFALSFPIPGYEEL